MPESQETLSFKRRTKDTSGVLVLSGHGIDIKWEPRSLLEDTRIDLCVETTCDSCVDGTGFMAMMVTRTNIRQKAVTPALPSFGNDHRRALLAPCIRGSAHDDNPLPTPPCRSASTGLVRFTCLDLALQQAL